MQGLGSKGELKIAFLLLSATAALATTPTTEPLREKTNGCEELDPRQYGINILKGI